MRHKFQCHFKNRLPLSAICIALLFLLPNAVIAEVGLEWEYDSGSNLSEYKVFSRLEGENYDFTDPIWVGSQKFCFVNIPDEVSLCYFIVVAIGSNGEMSPPSNEICYGCTTCPNDPDTIFARVCNCDIPDIDLVDNIDIDSYDDDDDNDGIGNDIEANSPNQGDGNLDGLLDSLQCNVGSLAINNEMSYVIIESPANARVNNFRTIDNPSPDNVPANIEFDYGLYEYEIRNVGWNNNIILIMTLPEGITPDTYYIYGRTPDNPTPHWHEFLYDGELGAEIDGNIINLHMGDALRGDNILTFDNMVISLGGPGFYSSNGDNNSPGSIHDGTGTTYSDSGCFVLTLSQDIR